MTDNDKKNMVKARLLVLTKMFYDLTDEDHVLDTFEIIETALKKVQISFDKRVRCY